MVIQDRRGYTLAEAMVTVAILGIVSSGMALVLRQTTKANLMSTALSDIQQEAFNSFDVLSKMLRQAQASSVVIDSLNGQQPPFSRITFQIPGGKQFSFYQNGSSLYYGSVVNAKDLRVLTFSYPNTSNPGIISVSMTFEKSIGDGKTKAVQLFIQKVAINN